METVIYCHQNQNRASPGKDKQMFRFAFTSSSKSEYPEHPLYCAPAQYGPLSCPYQAKCALPELAF